MTEKTKYNKLKDEKKFYVKRDANDHIVYRWRCPRCPKEGYIFGLEAGEILRNRQEHKLIRRKCNNCYNPETKIVYRINAAKAIHLNNIKRRNTDIQNKI